MASKRSFLVTPDYPNGLSRTAFRRLPREDKREVMVAWFRMNYEDPANRLPYETAEGGYQWIEGGPYDAEEVLQETFDGLASRALIHEAVEEVEEEGLLDWARSDNENEQPEYMDPGAFAVLLEDLPVEAGDLFGSQQDLAARQTAIDALTLLDNRLVIPRTIWRGDNHPPEPIEVEAEDKGPGISLEIRKLREELKKVTPDISIIKQLALPLRDAAMAVGKWGLKKADLVVDESLRMAVKAGGLAAVFDPNTQAAIYHAFHTVVDWIHLVTMRL